MNATQPGDRATSTAQVLGVYLGHWVSHLTFGSDCKSHRLSCSLNITQYQDCGLNMQCSEADSWIECLVPKWEVEGCSILGSWGLNRGRRSQEARTKRWPSCPIPSSPCFLTPPRVEHDPQVLHNGDLPKDIGPRDHRLVLLNQVKNQTLFFKKSFYVRLSVTEMENQKLQPGLTILSDPQTREPPSFPIPFFPSFLCQCTTNTRWVMPLFS